MRIYEEYFNRHKIKPTVHHHIQNGSILVQFEENGKFNWLVTRINWCHDPLYHPGKYYLQTMQPLHGSARMGIFQDVHEREEIYHEQYHDRLEHLIRNVKKGSIVRGEKEVTLAVWSMFLYCQDTNISRLSNADLKIYPTIDPTKSVDERYEAIQGLRNNLLHYERSDLGRLWHVEFEQRIIDNYLYWLADLAA